MTAVSAINPLRVAIVAALETTSVGTAVFHEGEVSRGTALPYIVLGTATENEEASNYMRIGHECTVQIKCWGNDSWDAQAIYEEAKAKLHNVNLVVAGHVLVGCFMTRISDLAEPNPEVGGHQVIGLLRTWTHVA